MVEDKADGRIRDILVIPMRAHKIAAGYILSTFLIGAIMSAFTLVVCVAYLATTGYLLSASDIRCTLSSWSRCRYRGLS